MEMFDITGKCPFFQKFAFRKSLLWKGILSNYCEGASAKYCERKRLYHRDGSSPCADVLPTGKPASKAFLSLP